MTAAELIHALRKYPGGMTVHVVDDRPLVSEVAKVYEHTIRDKQEGDGPELCDKSKVSQYWHAVILEA